MKCYHTDEPSGALGCSAINAAFVKEGAGWGGLGGGGRKDNVIPSGNCL